MDKQFKYITVKDIKTEGNFISAITFKPRFAILMGLVLGILLLIPNLLLSRILGLFFIVLSIIVFKLVNDYKVLDIFDKGVMIYGDIENKTAMFVDYDEINKWCVNHDNGKDTIEFVLNNNQKIIKNTFQAGKAYRVLYALIKEKEKNYINSQKKVTFSIPDAYQSLVERFRNKK